MARLDRTHPARQVPQDIPTYWAKPGQAVTEIHQGLLTAGVRISEPVISFNDREQNARHTFFLEDRDTHEVIDNSMLVFTWHWLTDTSCEVVAYLS